MYVGQIRHTTKSRCKQHATINAWQSDKSSIEEHCIETDHRMNSDEMTTS